MSTERAKAVEELHALNQELEDIRAGFIFNDGEITDEEEAALEIMRLEIDKIKGEISQMGLPSLAELTRVNIPSATEEKERVRNWLTGNYRADVLTEELIRFLKTELHLATINEEEIRTIINEVATSMNILPIEEIPGLNPIAPFPEGAAISEITKFHFDLNGFNLDLDLAKEFTQHLPASWDTGSVDFIINGNYNTDFSLKIQLNGIEHLNLQLVQKYNIKENTFGVAIQYNSDAKICVGANPETVRANIIRKVDELKATLSKLRDDEETASELKSVVGSIIDIYSEVESLKEACTELSRFTIRAGVNLPLGEGEGQGEVEDRGEGEIRGQEEIQVEDRYPSVGFTFVLRF